MSTLKSINVIHPSGTTNNIVNDASGNVTIGAALTAGTVTSPSATALTIQSAGTTAMTVDTSQNVGIGTTAPSSFASKLVVGTSDNANGVIASAATALVRIGGYSSGKSAGYIEALNTAQSAFSPLWFGGSILQFATSGSEAMRIDTSGNLLLNTTTSPTYAIQTGTTKSGSPNVRWEWGPSIVNNAYYVVPAGAASGVYISSGSTSWSSNSDERLKNITANIENAAQSVNSLRAVRFTWKSDEENKPNVGLIAQDVLAVLPEAVTEDRGYYGVKYTDVVPLLVAAIQELSAKNDALEARLAALEAK